MRFFLILCTSTEINCIVPTFSYFAWFLTVLVMSLIHVVKSLGPFFGKGVSGDAACRAPAYKWVIEMKIILSEI
jgi:hypothetical protein